MIDTDPTLGGFGINDIDDVLAILFLLASPEVRVGGITVTYGNSSLKNTLKAANRMCSLIGRQDIPVLPGASSRKDRGPSQASDFIIEYFRENAGKAVLLTLGPLTNIAAALDSEPRLAEWIPAVVIMGGNIGAPFPLAPYYGFEFNSASDARATDKVLKSGIKVWLITADLCMQARFGPTELARLRELNNECAALRLCTIDLWIRQNKLVLGPSGFVPWDPVAAALLTNPELYEGFVDLPLSMNRKGWKRRLIFDTENAMDRRTRLPLKLDAQRFIDTLVAKLSQI